MKRCKSCLTKAEPRNEHCPVCGIAQDKKGKELSPAEKKVRRHAHGIRFIALVHLAFAAIAILIMPEFAPPVPIVVIAVTNSLLAYGLVRYALMAYRIGIVFYFFIGMVGVISIQRGGIYLGWIAFALIALYLVGNGTAKAIFERRLPEAG